MADITEDSMVDNLSAESPDILIILVDAGLPCLVAGEPLWATVAGWSTGTTLEIKS